MHDQDDYYIEQHGNFFIMDSETLVSNPFQELQQEAINEAQRKNSMTEKLTSVKNNVCENHFNMTKSRLDRQRMSKLKQLHDHSNKLRHEVNLLDLDRQRHHIEIKKRMVPERDYSYDDAQIVNTEKRLGANIASFYLDKKLKYPTRLRSVSDIGVTPTIRKARASLRFFDLQKSMEDHLVTHQDRVQTAKTVSSSQTAPSALARRRGSRSAPVYARTGHTDKGKVDPDALPAISQCKSQPETRDQLPAYKGKTNLPQQQPPHVKFAFDNPLKILASSEESAKLFTRSQTYYPGVTRAVNHASESSDDDDDDSCLPEYIDLKALFSGKGNRDNKFDNTESLAQSQQNFHQYMLALRKAQGRAPKLTTDMKQVQTDYINTKIQTFLDRLATPAPRKDDTADLLQSLQALRPPTPRVSAKSTNTDDKPKFLTNTKSTSTSDLFATAAQTSDVTKDNPSAEVGALKPDEEKDENESPRQVKYSWKYIKGRPADGQLRGTYKSEDLVLQSLTGVPISNVIQTHVPLHSASRAMRHTATFKMHKIVEKLINDRTKYERHQVEELKRQMTGVDNTNVSSPGGMTRRVSDIKEPNKTATESARRVSTTNRPVQRTSSVNEPTTRMSNIVTVK